MSRRPADDVFRNVPAPPASDPSFGDPLFDPTPEQYDALGRWLDGLDAHVPPPPETNPRQLQPYRDAGLADALIPLHRWNHSDEKGERGKTPRDPQWRRRMYTPAEIQQWIENGSYNDPGGNVGFRIPPGWIVFDYDPRNVPEGRDVLAEFRQKYGIDLMAFPRVRTGSGGLHAYGRAPIDLRVRNALEELHGIEFKALGRQVVAPGSIHPCGFPYCWLAGPPLKEAPEWPQQLLDAIKRPEPQAGAQEEIPLTEAEALLRRLDPTDFQDHDRWLELMMAFHSATGGSAEAADVFIDWSTSDPAYTNHGELIRQRWDSLKVRAGGVTVGTLYHRVIEKHGHVPPAPPETVFDAVGGGEADASSRRPAFTRDANGKILKTLGNAMEAIRALGIDPQYDWFRHRIALRGDLRPLAEYKVGDIWDDNVKTVVKVLISERDKVEFNQLSEAAHALGLENSYDSLVEYLDSLSWDGKPRIAEFFSTYCGSENTAYVRGVARVFFLGAVARAYRPGIKFDTMVVLESPQGQNKSGMLDRLGGDFYSDGISQRGLAHPDTVDSMQGQWIIEVPELAATKRTDVETLKAFLSRRKDRARLAYKESSADYPRRCVLVGTTNDASYLRDHTGGRRFLPVTIKRADLGAVERDRHQLWAEAVAEWNSASAAARQRGEPEWKVLVLDERLWEAAAAEQEARTPEDPWVDLVREWLDGRPDRVVVGVRELLAEAIGKPGGRCGQEDSARLRVVMSRLGWEHAGKDGAHDPVLKKTVKGYRRCS
ncbi:MAG: hypothetical protein DCC71_12120 [Proteobacteria bacterium]|nr:MAG: hypothetical protein DCC71_12120 [Pseudomonadota bacterium]